MRNNITFGKYEAICMALTLLAAQLFLNLPRMMMEEAYTAAWILVFYVSVLALALFALIARLYTRFEGKDLLDLGEHIGGNTGRILVGTILFFYLLYLAFVILREFSENMKIIALPQSPLSFVMFFFLAGMIVAAYLGIEAIARLSAIFVPIIAIGYLLIIIGSAQYFDISRITPWLGSGAYEIFVKGIHRVSVFGGLVLVYLLFPYYKAYNHFRSVGYASILLSGFFFFTGTLSFSLIYQYPTGTESFLPIYQLARLINYGRFFQRVESVFVLIWAASALLHLSILLFFIAYVFTKAFKLTYYRPLVIPFSILVYTLSFFPHNLTSAIELEDTFRHYAWTVAFLLPIILLILARLVNGQKKKGGKNA